MNTYYKTTCTSSAQLHVHVHAPRYRKRTTLPQDNNKMQQSNTSNKTQVIKENKMLKRKREATQRKSLVKHKLKTKMN